MANKVTLQVAGGEGKAHDGLGTVGDARTKLGLGTNHTATVKGEPEDDDFRLSDYDYVAFAPAVKGGM